MNNFYEDKNLSVAYLALSVDADTLFFGLLLPALVLSNTVQELLPAV